MLGLVSSKTPALENVEELKRRTQEAARYIDLDRLADLAAMRLCFDGRRKSG